MERRSAKQLDAPRIPRKHASALHRPPKMRWALQGTNEYAAFLSHYKVQSGMEARYLHDMLYKILKAPNFLDSQHLRNLSHLFSHGLGRSDVLVLLLTQGVLLRPYCLLELWYAQRFGVPIILLMIAERGFEWDEARAHLRNLSAALST